MPNDCEKRNEHPACGQKKATDSLDPARESVCGLNALLKAEERAHRGVGYKNSVSRFHMLALSRCAELSNELSNGEYRPAKGERHEVWEPKYRVVSSSKYLDRVPQASFSVNYFYKKIVPHLIENNYACIKGRGVDLAREKLKEILRSASEDDWCLKADMKNYLASIRHEALYGELGEYIADPWAMEYFRQTVENATAPDGLDLGSEIYQLSATSFLNRLDHMLDDGKYIRFQDDLLYVGAKPDCVRALRIIREEAARLGLVLAEKKTYMQPVRNPIRFLGFTFWRHETGRVTLKRLPEKLRHERRKLRRMRNKGIPADRVRTHYMSVRAGLRKGSRSDLYKMDRYAKALFGEIF